MSDLTAPKAILPLANETFLSRHVDLLAGGGVRSILVVTNSKSAARLEDHVDGKARVIVSPFAGNRPGSARSVLCGIGELRRDAPAPSVLVMDADIVYERSLLEVVLEESVGSSRLFAIDRTADDAEEVRVYGHSVSEPVLIGKDVTRTVANGLTCLGESLGIIYLDAADVVCAGEVVESLSASGAEVEHEEVWQQLFTLGRLGVRTLSSDLLFADCDTPADYNHIRSVLLPAIREKDSADA
jgi:choline kinase